MVVGLDEIGAIVGFGDTGVDEGASVTGAADKGAAVTGDADTGAAVTGDAEVGAAVTGDAVTGAAVSAFEGAGVIGVSVGSVDKVLTVVGADVIGDLVG